MALGKMFAAAMVLAVFTPFAATAYDPPDMTNRVTDYARACDTDRGVVWATPGSHYDDCLCTAKAILASRRINDTQRALLFSMRLGDEKGIAEARSHLFGDKKDAVFLITFTLGLSNDCYLGAN